MTILAWCFNLIKLAFLGLFFLAFLRAHGKWGILLFTFACSLFGSLTAAEWFHPEFTPLVFVLFALLIVALLILDRLFAWFLWLIDHVILLINKTLSASRSNPRLVNRTAWSIGILLIMVFLWIQR